MADIENTVSAQTIYTVYVNDASSLPTNWVARSTRRALEVFRFVSFVV